MAIELTGILPKHERRLRLVFSSALASGGFGSPAPSAYVIDNEDGAGPSPGVSAAIIVAGAVTNVELALDADLAEGALYRVRAIGVPGADASASTAASDQRFRFAVSSRQANQEPKTSDADLLLHGRDLVWTGLDLLETAEGDLSTTSGPSNTMGAIKRRMLGSPLAWAPGYSPRAREYVDVPVSAIGSLRGRLESQALRDDRVVGVTAKLVLDDEAPEQSYFEVTPRLVGGRQAEPVDVQVFV
jgi:hypothetical protein